MAKVNQSKLRESLRHQDRAQKGPVVHHGKHQGAGDENELVCLGHHYGIII